MNAGKQLDKSRLTGPVFADDRVDFARFESEINGLKRMRGSEALVELLQLQNRSAACATPGCTALCPCCVSFIGVLSFCKGKSAECMLKARVSKSATINGRAHEELPRGLFVIS